MTPPLAVERDPHRQAELLAEMALQRHGVRATAARQIVGQRAFGGRFARRQRLGLADRQLPVDHVAQCGLRRGMGQQGAGMAGCDLAVAQRLLHRVGRFSSRSVLAMWLRDLPTAWPSASWVSSNWVIRRS